MTALLLYILFENSSKCKAIKKKCQLMEGQRMKKSREHIIFGKIIKKHLASS